jgi:uncharacterized membrane protein
MATLTAWKFDDPDQAEEATGVLQDLHHLGLINLIDAAWVTWPAGKRGPKTHQLHHPTALGAVGGGFFGFFFGLIFFVPILGLALGAATGAAAFKLTDVCIEDHFIDEVREKVTPGTSALFRPHGRSCGRSCGPGLLQIPRRADHQQSLGRAGEEPSRDVLLRLIQRRRRRQDENNEDNGHPPKDGPRARRHRHAGDARAVTETYATPSGFS